MVQFTLRNEPQTLDDLENDEALFDEIDWFRQEVGSLALDPDYLGHFLKIEISAVGGAGEPALLVHAHGLLAVLPDSVALADPTAHLKRLVICDHVDASVIPRQEAPDWVGYLCKPVVSNQNNWNPLVLNRLFQMVEGGGRRMMGKRYRDAGGLFYGHAAREPRKLMREMDQIRARHRASPTKATSKVRYGWRLLSSQRYRKYHYLRPYWTGFAA